MQKGSYGGGGGDKEERLGVAAYSGYIAYVPETK